MNVDFILPFNFLFLTSLHCSQRSYLRKTKIGFSPRGLAYFYPCDVIFFFLFKARVSIKRLEEFLDLEELDPDNVQRKSRKNEAISNL